MKTENMQSLFKRLFTTLLLVVAVFKPTVVLADISITVPTGSGTTEDPFLITNVNELYWFAGRVNGTIGLPSKADVCAKLMNNITVNSGVLKSDGTLNSDNASSFTAWEPIGYYNSSSDYVVYTGTFDGNGKTISGLYLSNNTMSYMGLFGYSSGTIKNVGVVDSYFKGYEYIGGVCGYNAGTVKLCFCNSYLSGSNIGGVCGLNYPGAGIANCYHTGTIKGGDNVGGVCGANTNGASITNCHNIGTLSGSTVGSVCGKNEGTISNCYYDSDKCTIKGINGADVSGQAEGKTTAQFQSGEIAYILQGSQSEIVWGQTIGTDTYPVIGGKEVYYGYIDCKNGMTYSNTVTSETPVHNYSNGFCTLCEDYQPAEKVSYSHHSELYPDYQDYYAIENAGQLYWFANQVNKSKNPIDVVLTADITVNSGVIDNNGELDSNTSGFRKWTPIGWWTETGYVLYNGIIEGNNHYISGLYYNDENTDCVGFLGYTNGTVKNLGIMNSYFKGGNKVGSMCGEMNGNIINCFFYNGQIHGTQYVGGLCGYSWGTPNIICNSYFAGTVSGTTNVGSICGLCEQENAIANCFYDKDKSAIGGINGSDVTGQAEGKTKAQFVSGEVAYLLSQGHTVDDYTYDGSNWGQIISWKVYPQLIGSNFKVYYGYPADGCIPTYSNTKPSETPTHAFSGNGFCTVCDTGYQPAKKVSDTHHAELVGTHEGYYAIENGGQLYWFAEKVNEDNTINAVLTHDITINVGDVQTEGSWRKWSPIGSYRGTFDGMEHTISGLYFNDESASSVGLISEINNANISNIKLSNIYFKGNLYVGAICGYLSQGTITNCNVSDGMIYSSYSHAGGICGYVESGTISNCSNSCSLGAMISFVGGICGYNEGTIDNCHNSADINADEVLYVGGVCGYNIGTLQDSYNSGAISSKDSYVGGVCGTTSSNNPNKAIINCYNLGTITATNGYVGGLCGESSSGRIKNCKNFGRVYFDNTDENYPRAYTGGLCGSSNNSDISYCINSGEVDVTQQYSGGICGYIEGGIIQYSYNEGTVSAADYYVGGVIGFGKNATLSNCYNTGTISNSENYAGGLAGGGDGITLESCHNSGSISSDFDYVGGIAAELYNKSNVMACYNTGILTGRYGIGGLVGLNRSRVTNSYNTGKISGNTNIGGLIGSNNNYASVTNCFSIGQVTGTGENIGGLCGYTRDVVFTHCYYNKEIFDGEAFGRSSVIMTGNESMNISQFTTGELAYLLSQGCTVGEGESAVTYDGSVWGQQLGVDNYPVPGSEYKLIAASKGNNNTYWSTFSNLDNDVTLSVPSNRTVEVYNATVSGGKMTLRKRSDNQVAKEEGVLLKSDNVYVNFKANETDVLTKVDYAYNNLVATPATSQIIEADDNYTLYRLTYNKTSTKEGLGFYLAVATFDNTKYFNGKYLKATPGKAYLNVYTPSSEGAPMQGFIIGEDDNTTGIDEITINGIDVNTGKYNEGVYDLQGRKVIKPAKGIYIKNGKKVIIK